MSVSNSRHSNVCVICGVEPATTRDHLPPKGFFKGTSASFITVPSCLKCNNGASQDDEELRFYISAQVGKESVSSRLLWEKGAYKSALRSKSLRTKVLESAVEMESHNAEGGSTKRLAFVVPVRLYQSVFERITRGLYFHHSGCVLPTDILICVNLLDGRPDISGHEFDTFQRNSIAVDAFRYLFKIADDNPYGSIWLYQLYETHWVLATTALVMSYSSIVS